MLNLKAPRILRTMIALLLLSWVGANLVPEAQARAGRSRSGGSSSYGSRPTPPPSAPSYSQRSPSALPPATTPPQSGGFMRGLAGGLAGGFLGSMLFSSLGHAAPGMGGGLGSGFGMLEVILIGALIFLAFRWWRGRQAATNAAYQGMAGRYGNFDLSRSPSLDRFEPQAVATTSNMPSFKALAPDAIDEELASAIFFKVQSAWTRRDANLLAPVTTPAMAETMQRDIDALKRDQLINKLENISIRRQEIKQTWDEGGDTYCIVRLTASLLDYTVDESSGRVVDGSDSEPTPFAEDWTFKKSRDGQWRLAHIEQV